MIAVIDRETRILLLGTAIVLIVATTIGFILQRTGTPQNTRTLRNLNSRIRAWWVMVIIFAVALAGGLPGVCILFALISFLALREMLTLAPTRLGDHHTLFWAFFVMIPLQYYLICIRWYGLYSIFIPVWCFLFLAIRSTLTGDVTRYLERTAKVQWGVMICIYCLSYAAALLMLDAEGLNDPWKLLVFLVIVVQMSDVLQYCWGMTLGRHKIAPHVSPNKTWEGFVGGVLSASALGMAIHWLTPFGIWRAGIIAFVLAVMGFFGGIVMSAVKRDAGIKDFGHLIEGHGGMLDRVDSLAFACRCFFMWSGIGTRRENPMQYRFLCCSDTHGDMPPDAAETNCTAWLHAGDLCRGAEAPDLYSDSDPLLDPLLAPVASWFATRRNPVFFVPGNHDVVDLYHASRWATNIAGSLVRVAERVCVAGIGWHGERYFELPFEADLRDCCESVLRMGRRLLAANDHVILLTHYPPRFAGMHEVPNDRDGGGVWYDCVRRVVEELRVAVVIQGHNHRWFGDVRRVEVAEPQVLIANPGPVGCVLGIDSETGASEVMPMR